MSDTRHYVGTLADLREDRLMTEAADGEQVLIVRHGGELYCIAAHCPHQFAPLIGGDVDEEGILTCLLHDWRFRLNDGRSPDNDFICVDAWECGLDGERIWVGDLKPTAAVAPA